MTAAGVNDVFLVISVKLLSIGTTSVKSFIMSQNGVCDRNNLSPPSVWTANWFCNMVRIIGRQLNNWFLGFGSNYGTNSVDC